MKNKNIFAMMLVIILTSALFLTACGKSGGSGSSDEDKKDGKVTLEQYAKDNKDVQESIDKATSDSDVEVSIKGNEVIYAYELSGMEGFTEDVAKDPSVVESLQTALDNAGPTFGGIAKTLEDATGISGIKVTVNYTYNDEMIATKTYDSSDASKKDTTEENSGEEGSDDGSSEETDSEEGEGVETDSADSAESDAE